MFLNKHHSFFAYIFASQNTVMEEKKSTGKYWLYFTIWTALLVYMLVTPDVRQWFWLALPGVFTHFAKGMDIM